MQEDCFKANMTQTGSKVLNEKESKEHLCKKIAFKFQGYHGPYWLQGFKWQREGSQGMIRLMPSNVLSGGTGRNRKVWAMYLLIKIGRSQYN